MRVGPWKKAGQLRIDAFELWCWRRPLRVPWTARRSNQSILRENSPEYSLERLMLKLKLQHFGHLMRRANSSEKTLMLWKIEGRKRKGQQRMKWLDGITGWRTVIHDWVTKLNCKCHWQSSHLSTSKSLISSVNDGSFLVNIKFHYKSIKSKKRIAFKFNFLNR